MSANGAPVEFRMPQEPLPVPALEDIDPVPHLSSPESQSFVVIKSASDLDKLLDDNELSELSLLQEHKQLLQDELAQFEGRSVHPQPSLSNNVNSLEKDRVSPDPGRVSLEPTAIQEANNGNNTLADMNQSVLPALPQPDLCNGVGAEDPDYATYSIISVAPSDFGSEELQLRVAQLIEENTRLKNTIVQNNLSMKTQYERIVDWQKDVDRVNDAHKEKFRNAKKCIETLRQDNALLKQEADHLRDALQQQQSEHDRTKQLLTETSEHNLKEFELDAANIKIKELEVALRKVALKKEEDLASETAKWRAMEEKLSRYEKELENAYKRIREFEKGAGDQQLKETGKLKLAQEKLLLSEMSNDSATKEIASLRNQLARNMQLVDGNSKLQHDLEQAVAERNALAADLESRNATVMDMNLRCSKLEERLQEANQSMRQHEEAIDCLKEREEQAKIEAWKAKKRVGELEQMCEQLQKNAEGLRLPQPQYLPPDFNTGELAYIRQQLMQSQRALTESEHNRAVANAQSQTMANEIAELRRQLEAKRNDGDDMFALRAQLDVYKTDFEAERETKEEVKRDKNKIAEDLQHLNRRNQQLQEEIELLREQLQQYGSVPRSHPSSATAPAPRDQYVYKCPKCNFGFTSVRAVENHVIRCIELDDSLP